MTQDESAPSQWPDIYGRVIAMEMLVTRLFASHARNMPNGAAAKMLADPEFATEIVGTITSDAGDEMEPGFLTEAVKEHLSRYLSVSQSILDKWNEGD